MNAEREFVERILEYRKLSREAREADQAALAAALADMDAALGQMESFRQMDTDLFPVQVEEVSSSLDREEDPVSGARVTALRLDGMASRVLVEVSTRDTQEHISVTLHPGKAQRVRKWLLEASSHGFDGSFSTAKSNHANAESALKAVKARLLAVALPLVSKDRMKQLPSLPDGDDPAAAVIAEAMEKAARMGREAERMRERWVAENAMTAIAVSAAWEKALPSLRFLEEIGYAVGAAEGEMSVSMRPAMGGIVIEIDHGEGYSSTVSVQAVEDDPDAVSFTVEDSVGRKELRSRVDRNAVDLMASEIRSAVMDEIEGTEAAYLPAAVLRNPAEDQERALEELAAEAQRLGFGY